MVPVSSSQNALIHSLGTDAHRMIAGWVLSGSWPSAWVTHLSREPHLSSVRFSNSFRFFSLRNSFGDSLFSQNIKSPVLLCWEFGSIFLLLEGFFVASAFVWQDLTQRAGLIAASDKRPVIVDFWIQVLCSALETPTHFATVMWHECRLHWFLCVLKLEKVFNKTC